MSSVEECPKCKVALAAHRDPNVPTVYVPDREAERMVREWHEAGHPDYNRGATFGGGIASKDLSR